MSIWLSSHALRVEEVVAGELVDDFALDRVHHGQLKAQLRRVDKLGYRSLGGGGERGGERERIRIDEEEEKMKEEKEDEEKEREIGQNFSFPCCREQKTFKQKLKDRKSVV